MTQASQGLEYAQFKINSMPIQLRRRLFRLAEKKGDVSEIAIEGIAREVERREREQGIFHQQDSINPSVVITEVETGKDGTHYATASNSI